ncbi:DNA polymerase III subunit chi [Rickettsiales endosymbiont of Stachyamoeba lipophora]|uniref:DNA polymerase III subunit chi n=1 Tax=Rickettsiales endosymbiont of Stachyamoeba lipophora TaxID=2486578 RepID=UPI000F64D92E|nr:DNA polymerase III subunit chi [Rickettsiales endosymbiont of Stachyamoeba lipophora]AZL15704.1 DNA polymerase III subunit chi [Rickettsiales endosymbiont of Stachyamoeba lipophora]
MSNIEVNFYHLTATTLDRALMKLLDKIISLGHKVKILCLNENQMSMLDQSLWSLGRISFLPHALDSDPFPLEQPIILSLDQHNNLNHADILLNLSEHEVVIPEFKKILLMFDSNNEEELIKARNRWKYYSGQNCFKPTYFKQDSQGNWIKNEQ